ICDSAWLTRALLSGLSAGDLIRLKKNVAGYFDETGWSVVLQGSKAKMPSRLKKRRLASGIAVKRWLPSASQFHVSRLTSACPGLSALLLAQDTLRLRMRLSSMVRAFGPSCG